MPTYVNDRPREHVELSAGTAVLEGLKTVTLLPGGNVRSEHGDMLVDEKSGQMIVETFKKRGTSVPIDIEHQSLGGQYVARDGVPKAAGWVEDMFRGRNGEILALVKWNERARELIRADEFRYLSPVTIVRKDDRRVVSIDSVALTNCPAIHHMDRVAASRKPRLETEAMPQANPETKEDADGGTLDGLVDKLGEALRKKGVELPEDAETDEIVKAAIKAIGGQTETDAKEAQTDREVAAQTRRRLGLPANAGADAVTLALSVGGDGQTRRQLAELQEEATERMVNDRLQPYLDKGILLPADTEQMATARRLARTDPDTFETLMSRAVPIVPQGRTTPPPRGAVERDRTIRLAMRQYGEDEGLKKGTSMIAHVNLALRDAGQMKLSDEDMRAWSIEAPR